MYIKPSFSKGGIEELLLDEMNDLRTDHHCLEVRLPDFNLSAKRSFIACLDSRIAEIPLLRIFLNLRQSEGLSVLLAFLYALLRFRISSFMRYVIQGGSPGRIVTTLLGIQVPARSNSCSIRLLAYAFISSFCKASQSAFDILSLKRL